MDIVNGRLVVRCDRCPHTPLILGSDPSGELHVFCPKCDQSRPALAWLSALQAAQEAIGDVVIRRALAQERRPCPTCQRLDCPAAPRHS